MSIQGDITILIDRLKRANIPMEHLCYELDEHEWQTFCRELEAMHIDYRDEDRDYSYVENMRFMGMPIRKRSAVNPEANAK
jgi:extradiol dioxygenase family protein